MSDLDLLLSARNAVLYQYALIMLGAVLVLDWAIGWVRARRLVTAGPAVVGDDGSLNTWQSAVVRWGEFVQRAWWLVLLGAVIFLRVVGVDRGPLWYDEAFTVWLTRLPFTQMLLAVGGDVHPPLYFALVWGWANLFGADPVTLRLLSALLSVAAFPLLKAIADELKLEPAAQAVGLLVFAASRFQIFYATDARMYALLQVLVLASVLCVFQRRWVWLSIVWALSLYTHNFGFIFAASTGLLALWREWRNREQLKRLLLAGVLAVLSYAPWAVVLNAQVTQVGEGHWIWPMTVAEVLLFFYTLLFNGGPYLLEGLAVLVTLAVLAIVAVRLHRHPSPNLAVLTWLTLGPVLVCAVVSALVVPIFVPRYLLPVGAFWALLIGWALTYRVAWWGNLAACVLLLPILSIGSFHPDRVLQLERGHPVEVARFISENFQQGDAILHLDVWTYVEGDQYLRGLPQYLYPQLSDGLNVGGLSLQTREALGMHTATPQELKTQYRRVWVIDAFSPIMPPAQRQSAWRDLAIFNLEKRDGWFDRQQLFGVVMWEANGR